MEIHQGLAWITIDVPGKRVNTLSTSLMEWFAARLEELEGSGLGGLVLRSGKPDTFVAGADIEELEALDDPEEVADLLREGHALLRRMSRLGLPVVSAIHGPCLGGGLELALAGDWRVATHHDVTRLGLPEVQLGLIPGLGGTQRLPRLVGVPAALDLILTGKQIRAKKALAIGLVDELCHEADLVEAAIRLARRGPRRETRSWGRQGVGAKAGDLLARTPLGNRIVYDKAREQVLARTGGHYPAPLTAIDVVRRGLGESLDRALEIESEAFVELVLSETAKSLIGIFFMKNDVDRRAGELAKKGRDVSRVGVLGAGLMGAGIAGELARKGISVVMKDRDFEALGRGTKYVADRVRERVSRRRMTEVEGKEILARLHPTVLYVPFDHLDFVIEAVFEDPEVKHGVLRETEETASDDLIFASNTSTIPIAEIAVASRRPENVVGMHFFSPVHKMPLLEVIRHPETSEETVATTVGVGKRMGKTTIVVDDGPGFFTSRVLGPYVNEAVWCLEQGARIEEVDRALKSWGWPVGALTLLDEVGLDVGYHAGRVMLEHFGERLEVPAAFQKMMDDGRRGRKSGRGFYRYEEGEKAGSDETVYELLGWEPAEILSSEIAERCWLQMLNEVARTIEDGVIENPADVDIGVVFGLGFPPFRGGILRHADRIGLDRLVERFRHYADRHGRRFEPADWLVEKARQGDRVGWGR